MKRTIYLLVLSLISLNCDKGSGTITISGQDIPVSGDPRGPGNSAADYLRSTNYKSLTIELQYMPGYRPDSRAIKMFTDLLNERLNKPGGITVKEKEINPSFIENLALSDLIQIESRNRTVYTSGDRLSAYLLFTSGSYLNNGNAIGLTYDHNSMCFFGEPLKYFLGGTIDDKIKLMALLMSHEFGHLLGLVNMGSPMISNHQDYANINHCNNVNCLMHYSNEGNKQNFERMLSSRTLIQNPAFDQNCINDLQANGGR